MWKAYLISGTVFAVAYALTRDYFFSAANGFGVFYLAYTREQKSEQHAQAVQT